MKKRIINIAVFVFSLFFAVSCVTPYEIYADDEYVTHDVIVRYGQPYYIDGVVSYYIWNGYYYYPRYMNNRWYYYRYRTPLRGYHPNHRGHHHHGGYSGSRPKFGGHNSGANSGHRHHNNGTFNRGSSSRGSATYRGNSSTPRYNSGSVRSNSGSVRGNGGSMRGSSGRPSGRSYGRR